MADVTLLIQPLWKFSWKSLAEGAGNQTGNIGSRAHGRFQELQEKEFKKLSQESSSQSTIEPILQTMSIDPQKKLNQITKKERLKLQETLKALPLTITGHLPLDKAMVTCGGVSKKQIDPQTMESKLLKGLYFLVR